MEIGDQNRPVWKFTVAQNIKTVLPWKLWSDVMHHDARLFRDMHALTSTKDLLKSRAERDYRTVITTYTIWRSLRMRWNHAWQRQMRHMPRKNTVKSGYGCAGLNCPWLGSVSLNVSVRHPCVATDCGYTVADDIHGRSRDGYTRRMEVGFFRMLH